MGITLTKTAEGTETEDIEAEARELLRNGEGLLTRIDTFLKSSSVEREKANNFVRNTVRVIIALSGGVGGTICGIVSYGISYGIGGFVGACFGAVIVASAAYFSFPLNERYSMQSFIGAAALGLFLLLGAGDRYMPDTTYIIRTKEQIAQRAIQIEMQYGVMVLIICATTGFVYGIIWAKKIDI